MSHGSNRATARALEPEVASEGRIRVFSRWVSLALAACALAGLPFALQASGSGKPGDGSEGWPWESGDTPAAERDGDTWHGEGATRIELRGLDPARTLRIDPVREDGRYLPLVATAPGGAVAPTGDRIDLSHYHPYHYLVPWQPNIDIWSYREDAGPWSVEVTQPELPECGSVAQGSGGAVFVYRGDATSARFVADDKLTYATVTTVLGTEYLGEEYPYDGPHDTSVSWDDTPYAVFVIAEGTRSWQTQWRLEFDETAASRTQACDFPHLAPGMAGQSETDVS